MNITFREQFAESGNRRTVIKPDKEDVGLLLDAIPDAELTHEGYVSDELLWDCIVDLITECTTGQSHKDDRHVRRIIVCGNPKLETSTYSPQSIVYSLWNRNQDPYSSIEICSEEPEQMETYEYRVICPTFDGVDVDYRINCSTLRSYSHPVDEKVIKVLNNPVVNAVFKAVVDVSGDSTMGTMIANGIPLNQKNYPDIDEVIRHCCKTLGIKRPYAFVSPQLPGLNAMTFGSDEQPYLVLSTLLVKTMSTEQIKFVVGHECGHIAMGHVVYHSAATTAGNLSQLIPIIGPTMFKLVEFPLKAWQRRSEITADRAGLLCCGDLEVAQRTLLQLTGEFVNTDHLDMESYIENSRHYLEKGTLRKLGEFTQNHPLIPKRMESLSYFANSSIYYELMGLPVPEDAIPVDVLEAKIEKIVSVL